MVMSTSSLDIIIFDWAKSPNFLLSCSAEYYQNNPLPLSLAPALGLSLLIAISTPDLPHQFLDFDQPKMPFGVTGALNFGLLWKLSVVISSYLLVEYNWLNNFRLSRFVTVLISFEEWKHANNSEFTTKCTNMQWILEYYFVMFSQGL